MLDFANMAAQSDSLELRSLKQHFKWIPWSCKPLKWCINYDTCDWHPTGKQNSQIQTETSFREDCIEFVPKSVLGLYQSLYWVCTKDCIGFVPKSALMLSLFYTELILIIGTNHCVFVSSSFVICMFNKCLINDIAFHTACLHSLSPPCIWEKHTLYTGNINQVKM